MAKKRIIQNKNLELPEVYLLKKIIFDYKTLVGKMQSDIDELIYKNEILIKKGKELESKLINYQSVENINFRKQIKKEELYSSIRQENKKLRKENKRIKKDNSMLISKILHYESNTKLS